MLPQKREHPKEKTQLHPRNNIVNAMILNNLLVVALN